MRPTFSLHSIIALHDRILSHYHDNIHGLRLAAARILWRKRIQVIFFNFFEVSDFHFLKWFLY